MGAGEPDVRPSPRPECAVDPRGCGGAMVGNLWGFSDWGRSPRVRGSQRSAGERVGVVGSIPAGAEEPSAGPPATAATRVDPRGCGGAAAAQDQELGVPGRSPRVRGSPFFWFKDGSRTGSIPAGAGEPTPRAASTSSGRVDPRGCGGALML